MNKLTLELSQALEDLIRKGKERARKILHAQVLLKVDSGPQGPNWSDQQIHEVFGVGAASIWRLRRRFVDNGLDDALTRRPQPERPEKRKVNGQHEAYLLALTGSQAPAGHKRWTMRLLADKMVALGYSEPISHKTVWVVLKKTNSNRGSRSNGVFHPRKTPSLSIIGRIYWRSISVPTTPAFPKSV